MDLYAVLGIPRKADEEAIRRAYRILARRYHPDRGAGSSTEKFRQVVEAYETLMDSGSRRAYDRSLGLGHAVARAHAEPVRTHMESLLQEDPRVFGHFGAW